MSLRAKVPPPQQPPADPLLTVQQLARREGVAERHVRRMIERGLPAFKACGIRIRLSEYERWLEGHRRPPTQSKRRG